MLCNLLSDSSYLLFVLEVKSCFHWNTHIYISVMLCLKEAAQIIHSDIVYKHEDKLVDRYYDFYFWSVYDERVDFLEMPFIKASIVFSSKCVVLKYVSRKCRPRRLTLALAAVLRSSLFEMC